MSFLFSVCLLLLECGIGKSKSLVCLAHLTLGWRIEEGPCGSAMGMDTGPSPAPSGSWSRGFGQREAGARFPRQGPRRWICEEQGGPRGWRVESKGDTGRGQMGVGVGGQRPDPTGLGGHDGELASSTNREGCKQRDDLTYVFLKSFQLLCRECTARGRGAAEIKSEAVAVLQERCWWAWGEVPGIQLFRWLGRIDSGSLLADGGGNPSGQSELHASSLEVQSLLGMQSGASAW